MLFCFVKKCKKNYKNFAKTLDILPKVWYNIDVEREEVMKMSNAIEKALQDIAKAIENNDAVSKVIVKIELKKQPQSSKAAERK